MARHKDHPLDTAVPEADRLEQEQPADPTVSQEHPWPDPATPEADADRLEQAQELPVDPDEDYPPNQTED